MRNKSEAAGASGGQGRSAAGNSHLQCHCTAKPAGGQFLWLGGRRVASIDADHVLRRTLHGSRHLYRGRGEESWSFHTPVIIEAQRIGAQAIEVRDADSGLRYRVSMAAFCRKATAIRNPWGAQMALPLRFWSVVNPRPTGPVQLGLFGGGA